MTCVEDSKIGTTTEKAGRAGKKLYATWQNEMRMRGFQIRNGEKNMNSVQQR